ncbi:MAG: alcohol dehydrogenase, partial [Actinomycetes bacterium]
MQVKASVLMGLNEPWTTEIIEIDEPKSNEVKVKMAFSGMCHSDEHLRTGDISQDPQVLEFLSGRNTMFP